MTGLLAAPPALTMSSREIADLCEARHNDVVATIKRLFASEVLRESRKTLRAYAPDGGGRPTQVYDLTKRDTLVVVSGYNDQVRARIIDRWMELEAAQRLPFSFTDSRSGMGLFRLGSRELVVDLNDFLIGPADRAVVMTHEGKYRVIMGPLETARHDAPYLGARIVRGRWEKPKAGDPYGASRVRPFFHVLGRVVEPGEKLRRRIAA